MKLLSLAVLMSMSSAIAQSNLYTISNEDLEKVQASLPELKRLTGNKDLSVIELKPTSVKELSRLIHERIGKCGGFRAQPSFAVAKKSLTISDDEETALSTPFTDYSIDQQEVVSPLVDQVSEERIRNTIIKLSSFQTRFHGSPVGIESSLYIKELWADLVKHRSDVKVEIFQHSKAATNQPSIILTIEGSELPEEIVVIGGHADSLSMDAQPSPRIAPGADDNASGIATLTEVIRLLMDNNFKPKRTLQFMAYAAEEVGLVGSDEIAKVYQADKKKVMGVLQLDMTLFKGTVDKDIALIADQTNKFQNEFLGRLIDEYVKAPWGYSSCGYGCSDHASWTSYGYPASFPFEAYMEDYNVHIHTAQDTLENAGGNAEHSVKFAKLATSFAIELGN